MQLNKCLMTILIVSVILISSVAFADQYKIGPGDKLEISVWRDKDLTHEIVVPPDNIISFPLIGDIDATGLSVTELRKVITERLYEYLPDASVNVMLKEISSMKAYVIGKVNNPGVFPIMMDTSVMQLLSMAKGLNPFASERDIHIIRQEGSKIKKIKFDYNEVLRGHHLEQNIFLKRGDVIIVP